MNKESNNSAYRVLKRFQSFRYVMILEGILVGIGAGLISILYRIMIREAESATKAVIAFLKSNVWAVPLWFVFLVAMAVIVGRMVRREPMISGSGIPQIEGEMDGHFDADWLKVTFNKFAGGIICMGAGLSLGREGPSIQLGAMIGKGISKIMKLAKMEEKFLITCGASAGLSAAFNAPLAGVMFALEEIHKNFSEIMVLSVMAASLVADFVSKNIFGLEPVFTFKIVAPVPLSMYWLVVLLGVVTGVLGAFYNFTLAKSQDMYKKLSFIKPELRIVIPFVMAGAFRSICQGHSADFLLGAHIPLNQPFYLVAHGFLAGGAEMKRHFISRVPDFLHKGGRVLPRDGRGVGGGGAGLFVVHRLSFRWRPRRWGRAVGGG